MIKCSSLTIRVGEEVVVSDFSAVVREGEVHLLAGPSGSGKSLILKTVAGLTKVLYAGVEVEGDVRVAGLNPEEALSAGLVAYIPQDLEVMLLRRSLREELEILGAGLSRRVAELLGIEEAAERDFSSLSAGMKYRVLVALALHMRSKVILLDEPSTFIDRGALEEVLKLLSRVASEEGVSVLIADHRTDLVGRYCDEVHYLGGTTCCYPLIPKAVSAKGYVELRNVWFKYSGSREWVIKGLNLRVEGGEVLTVLGPNASGKTTFSRLAAGFLKPSKGSVKRLGRIFYVPQEPTYWFVDSSVAEVVRSLGIAYHHELLDAASLARKAGRPPHSLSVGEARRLSTYLALHSGREVVILDEPTLGLDYESTQCVKEMIRGASDSGMAVIVATHDEAFADGLGGKIIKLPAGEGTV